MMTISKVACPLLRHRQLLLLGCKVLPLVIPIRHRTNRQKSVVKTSTKSELDTNVKPLGEKVKEATKTVSYLGVILLGVAVTGTLFYAIFRELFSSKSPNSVYTKAYKKCMGDSRVEDKLGLPITAFGEESRRGRRQHVNHVVYEKEGRKYIRMQFYLKGSYNKGTVHLEMVENETGRYEYRYLFITVNDLHRTVIVIENNLNDFNVPTSVSTLGFE